MVRSVLLSAAAAGLLSVCSIGPGAAAARPPDGPVVSSAVAGTILGTVWDSMDRPVPNALVRLRNLTTARVEATTRSDESGRFTFQSVEGGNYTIELVNDEERVIAVGQRFSVAPGETVATFVRLRSRLPWFAAFFNNAAATAVAGAATIGVTAVAAAGQPVSPTK